MIRLRTEKKAAPDQLEREGEREARVAMAALAGERASAGMGLCFHNRPAFVDGP